jgi:large subunit ribosomal protein L18
MNAIRKRTAARSAARLRRHRSVRRRLSGTGERPRLVVYRSLKHIYAQIVDDQSGRTLAAASTVEADLRDQGVDKKVKQSMQVGLLIAKRAQDVGVKAVCFDRNGYLYHGRVKALADAARENGLEF